MILTQRLDDKEVSLLNIELPNIRNILGWLTFNEAVALQMCTWHCSGLPGDIVEIGSYCGKSTVAIADALKQGCSGMLHSIDPHSNNVENYGVDSWQQLQDNIVKFKVEEFVQLHKSYSFNFDWQGDIKMLFIDGCHEYESVKRDFQLYEKFVVKHGSIAFHDSYEEGPQQVIDEAMQTQQYMKLLIADSLTVLKKL